MPLDVRIEHLLDIGLADGADPLLDHLAAFEQQQRGNPADVIAHGRLAVVVDVQFADLCLARILGRDNVNGWRHHPARSAPFSPEINQHRFRRVEHLGVEGCVGQVQNVVTRHLYLPSSIGSRFCLKDAAISLPSNSLRYRAAYSAAETRHEKSLRMPRRIMVSQRFRSRNAAEAARTAVNRAKAE